MLGVGFQWVNGAHNALKVWYLNDTVVTVHCAHPTDNPLILRILLVLSRVLRSASLT